MKDYYSVEQRQDAMGCLEEYVNRDPGDEQGVVVAAASMGRRLQV